MGAHYERAQVLIRQKRYVEAERELREELAENPHGGLTHAFLGHCLAQQKHMTEAVEAGEEGVRLSPELAHVHYLLGLTFVDCRRHEEAEAALREALRLNPRNASYLEWLSWVQLLAAIGGAPSPPPSRGWRSTRSMSAVSTIVASVNAYWGIGKTPRKRFENRCGTIRRPFHSREPGDGFVSKAIARARGERKATSWPWRPEMAKAHQHYQEALRLNPCSDFAKNVMTEILSAPMTRIVALPG